MDAKALFTLDPMAAISYGQYNAVKKDKGSFEDFLLHYNSYEANEGNSKWLQNLISKNSGLNALASNPELLNSMDALGFDFSSSISTSNFLDTKIELLKLNILSKINNKK